MRLVRGGDAVVFIPFTQKIYSDLSLSFYTDGAKEIGLDENEVYVDENGITAVIAYEYLDGIEDGTLKVSITYSVEGIRQREEHTLPYVLRTPLGYSAASITEVVKKAYQSGYTFGYNSGFTFGYESGHTDGEHETLRTVDGEYELLPDFSGNSGDIYPDSAHNGFSKFVVVDNGFTEAKYNSGWTDGHASALSDVAASATTLRAWKNGTYTPSGENVYFKNVIINSTNKRVVASGTFETFEDFVCSGSITSDFLFAQCVDAYSYVDGENPNMKTIHAGVHNFATAIYAAASRYDDFPIIPVGIGNSGMTQLNMQYVIHLLDD